MTMTDDALRERIEELEGKLSSTVSARDITIRDLRAENARLRAALEQYALQPMGLGALAQVTLAACNSKRNDRIAGETMGEHVDMRAVLAWCETCRLVHDRWKRECPNYVPVIDWSSMSPRGKLEALKDAPKVAGPWERFRDGSGVMRPDHRGDAAGLLSAEDDSPVARQTCDEEMLRDGWVLVD